MHVLIDARMATSKKFGFGRYVHNLLKQFTLLDQQDRFTFLVNDLALAEWGKIAPNIDFHKVDIKWLSVSEQLWLPLVIRKIRPDVFFSPTFIAPVVQPCPTVIAIHDLMHVIFSKHYFIFHKIYYGLFLRSAAKNAKMLITKSGNSKRDIMRYYGIPEEKIVIIPDGVEAEFKPIRDVERIKAFRQKLDLPPKFILFVGARKVNKNIEGILAAYSVFCGQNSQYSLVLSGNQDAKTSALAKKYRIEDKIAYIGEIEEADLPLLYNSADLFLSPSLYEGFGLPHLEAMACGLPVIASNASSLPEVVGDAGILVDPRRPDDIAAAMVRVLGDKELKDDLVRKGLERAKKFSWEISASGTLDVCRNASGEH
ncbi:glycosyltransferase family 4 protein [Candidatus Margulisiibacteriota bacterium]